MKFKLYHVLWGTLFLIGCGSEAEQNQEDEPIETETSLDVSEEATEEEEVSEVSENGELSGEANWQIDQYASKLLKQEILLTENMSETQRRDLLWGCSVLDVKGGYIEFQGLAMEGFGKMGLWRMKNGDDLVIQMMAGCGPACAYDFYFFKGVNDGIQEIPENNIMPVDELNTHVEDLLPEILEKYPVDYPEDHSLVYNIPNAGTYMTVDLMVGADEVMIPVAKLSWDKEKFSISEKLSDLTPTY